MCLLYSGMRWTTNTFDISFSGTPRTIRNNKQINPRLIDFETKQGNWPQIYFPLLVSLWRWSLRQVWLFKFLIFTICRSHQTQMVYKLYEFMFKFDMIYNEKMRKIHMNSGTEKTHFMIVGEKNNNKNALLK